ncbi:hypothetical protein GCM10027194_08060 [Thalassiella azotivora]
MEDLVSFQAYLDNAEKKTGRTPQEIVDLLRLDGIAARES